MLGILVGTMLATMALVAGCSGAPQAGQAGQAGQTVPAAPATVGIIAGVVVDIVTGDPLSFAEVEATEWNSGERKVARIATGADGSYRVIELPPGTYMVDVKYAKHRQRFFAVPVTAGATTPLDASIDTGKISSDSSYQYIDIVKNPVVHAAAADPARFASQAKTTGGIRGRVRDIASKDYLEGAVVAATTPGVRNAAMAIADDDGSYVLRSLRPGIYTLSVYYHLVERGNIEVRRTNVSVVAGEITEINLDLDAKTDE